MTERRYLGDGVYVSFDGYQLWLAANHHENRVIALEPAVLLDLIKYAEEIGILNRRSLGRCPP